MQIYCIKSNRATIFTLAGREDRNGQVKRPIPHFSRAAFVHLRGAHLSEYESDV